MDRVTEVGGGCEWESPAVVLPEGGNECVLAGGQKSEPGIVEVEVKQGCALGPVIFNLLLTAVITLNHSKLGDDDGVWIQKGLHGNFFNLRRLQARIKFSISHFMELQYANDCALLTHSPEALQHTIAVISTVYKPMGPHVNTKKTEIHAQHGITPVSPLVFQTNGIQPKQIKQLTYLDSVITPKHNVDDKIQSRIHIASESFGRLRSQVLDSENLQTETKTSVYKSVSISTLMYRSETWTNYRRHIKVLEAFYIRSLRRILSLTWQDKV
ncbi:uncharacterized protein LOC143018294 [Oratosquilla oratoria]|uniref:uncharacterized protein LOC143018294 n=1 Tax=Oratosquilla oratoria TaxID=337810 RepID=UPI003F777800